MQFFQNKTPIFTSDNMESSVMGMSNRGWKMACQVLRDNIYTDKIGGVIREYACNALDEHVKFNIDRPVEIKIVRDNNDYVLSFRDFAYGLGEDAIRNVFARFFESTKSHSDEFIGGYGVGSKIFHAYTDTFYVVSHFEGEATTYCCVLGGDDVEDAALGTSVAKIIKVSAEPTNETGIEVFANIQASDVYNFDNKAREFVRYCSLPIQYTDIYANVFVPETPEKVVTHDIFTFKFFAKGDMKTRIRMGNVTYKSGASWETLGFDKDTAPLDAHNTLIVEIPIGTMSLPISREAFEDTQKNRGVFEQLSLAIKAIVRSDLQEYYDLPLMDIIKDKNESYIKGQIFHQFKRATYPDVWPFVSNLRRTNFSLPESEKHKGKLLVALIPNKRSRDAWIDKLNDLSTNSSKSYYWVEERHWETNASTNSAITDLFVAKKVKSRTFFPDLGRKKDDSDVDLSKFEKTYNVRKPGSHSRYQSTVSVMNALQVHNEARQHLGLETAEDVEEAQEQMVEMQSFDYKSVKDIYWFTVAKSTATCESWWTTAAQGLYTALIELGWDDAFSVTVRDKVAAIRNKEAEESKNRALAAKAIPDFFEHSYLDKMRKRCARHPKRAQQMNDMWEKLREEKTLRGKILYSLGRASYYYEYNKYTRQNLRGILSLKN